jgi:hypothetical protein
VQIAHGNVVAAVSPEQIDLPPLTRTIGGPPFWHFAGGALTGMHAPPAHAVVGPHPWPHVPQFWLSAETFTQAPLQAVRLPEQDVAHVPFEQTLPGAQTTLQPPQFEGSPTVGMHLPPQSDS